MSPIDQRGKLEEAYFSYRITKDHKVLLYWYDKQVKILSGDDAKKLIGRLAVLDEYGIQLALAKATGNFKRGNEKSGKMQSR